MRGIFYIFAGILAVLLAICACGGQQTAKPTPTPTPISLQRIGNLTEPSGYLEVLVSPDSIHAVAGEQIEIKCSITSRINTPVNMISIDMTFLDSSYQQIRKQSMDFIDYWSANTTYTIVGDESFYRPLINFSINLHEPQYYSEFTADVFTIN